MDKIAEGMSMFLSGPAPSFAGIGLKLASQAALGITDNVQHYCEVGRRRNALKRRTEHLLKQTGNGFWSGLQDCFKACSVKGRDEYGYAVDGRDEVPEHQQDS